MGSDKGCNKWLTYGLGFLALLFLVLTITFGVMMGQKSTKEVVVEKIVEVDVPDYERPYHPLKGHSEATLAHPYFDPITANAAHEMFRNGAPALSDKVEAIYSKLTHRQRIGQLIQYAYGDITGPDLSGEADPSDWVELAAKGEVGSFLNVVAAPAFNDWLQQSAVGGVGIPVLMGFDVIHGHRAISPNPLGLAASWDPDMVENLSRLAAIEAKVEGVRWTFAPMVDVGRDPRWGRVMETWGESAYMAAVFGPAVVKGFQSENVAACVKHVAAYGLATNGAKDYSGNDMNWVHLHNDYFEGYEATVDAGALTSMASFNTIQGVPVHANREMNTDVQRGLWGFKGMMVSDYSGTRELGFHGYCPEGDRKCAALKSFFSGVDMNMADGYYRELWEIPEDEMYLNHTFAEYVDLAARRAVYVKEQVGLFEDNGILGYENNAELWNVTLLTAEGRKAITEAAERSAVLLKNDNEALPLDPFNKDNKILIVGKIADDHFAHVGAWHAAGTGGATVGWSIRTFLGETDVICGTGHSTEFNPLKTGDWCAGDPEPQPEPETPTETSTEASTPTETEASSESSGESPAAFDDVKEVICNIDYLPGYACQMNIDLTKDEPMMKQVEEAIAANDYTHIIFVGGENDGQNGEGAVRAHLELPHAQSMLSRRIVEAAEKKANKPKLIMIPIIARPNILTYEDEHYDAILLPWAPGTLGGTAIWNLIQGKLSPGGSITATFPRAVGQIPIYHEMPWTGRPPKDDLSYPPYEGGDNADDRYVSRYIDESVHPLYPFGYGLSYASFSMTPSVSPSKVSIKEDTPITVNMSVTRSGSFTGKAAKVYQVYVQHQKAVPVPVKKRIRGFARFDFDEESSGTTLTASVTIVPSKDFSRFDTALNKRVEPGQYKIFVGENAEDERYSFDITVE